MTEADRQLVTERDEHRTVYAVELVDADRWDEAFLRLDPLPAWLAVETPPRNVAEAAAVYAGERPRSRPRSPLGATLWPRSPSHRAPGASLA